MAMSTVVRQIRYHAPALHSYVEVRVMGSSADISTDARTYTVLAVLHSLPPVRSGQRYRTAAPR